MDSVADRVADNFSHLNLRHQFNQGVTMHAPDDDFPQLFRRGDVPALFGVRWREIHSIHATLHFQFTMDDSSPFKSWFQIPPHSLPFLRLSSRAYGFPWFRIPWLSSGLSALRCPHPINRLLIAIRSQTHYNVVTVICFSRWRRTKVPRIPTIQPKMPQAASWLVWISVICRTRVAIAGDAVVNRAESGVNVLRGASAERERESNKRNPSFH